jgi:16S rRNA (guanine(966)-N(2))-methyltransferase RsmD
MRVVGGTLGGRRFQPPARIPARPTTDMAREGLFNILTNLIDLEGSRVLDLFSGTGSIAYECFSREATSVDCVEKDATSADFIRKTASEFGITTGLRVIKSDVFSFLEKIQETGYDVVFADPPYAHPRMKDLPDLIFQQALRTDAGLCIVEHDGKTDFSQHPHFHREVKYGDTRFSFFIQQP